MTTLYSMRCSSASGTVIREPRADREAGFSAGLPARYVSGYILTHPAPGKPRLVGADASHAWVSVYCPDYGWVDADPTNGILPSLEHVTLGWGRDYDDVIPLRGVLLGGGDHELDIAVTVAPVDEYDKVFSQPRDGPGNHVP